VATADDLARVALLRRGFALEYATLAWNAAGIVVLAIAAVAARSVALAGFGLDSLIEIGASMVVVRELSGAGAERQRRSLRLIGYAFLRDLSPWRWAPTFIFADQQAAEIHWTTLVKVAAFRRGRWKAELWILMSPAMIAKGVAGTGAEGFMKRVDALYGTADWRRIQAARGNRLISAEDYRDEMVIALAGATTSRRRARWFRKIVTMSAKVAFRVPGIAAAASTLIGASFR